MNPLLERYPYPGKFEGELNLAERLWNSDGGADDELGDESFGYFMYFKNLDKDSELGDLDNIVAAILSEDSQGLVTATYYSDREYSDAMWRHLERQWEKAFESEES